MIKQKVTEKYPRNTNHLITKYFFIFICTLEIGFVIWRYIIVPTKNSETFLFTFIVILLISFLPGLALVLNIFKEMESSFAFTFGLCIGYGLIAGIWSFMILLGCPLNPYLYTCVVFFITGFLLYRKRYEFKALFTKKCNLNNLLPPFAILLFTFIILSTTWLNSHVMTDVDCQSDSYNTLMILKEGSYPIVSPYLDQTKLQLNSGPLFHTLIAVITKLKNSILHNEIMAITITSGAFFSMAIYFLVSFLIKNEIILFLAGILTLTRAYLSFFNDGNLPENIAFYYAALFIIFIFFTIEKKKIIFAVISGLCLSFCMLSHPMIFLYNAPPFGLFFITFLFSKNKNVIKDYINLSIILSTILIFVFPFILRLKGAQVSNELFGNDATTLIGSLPYWNGYIVLILALVGIILLATKRESVNIYFWTYFLIVLIFVEHWRFFQILSPPWFELKSHAIPIFGSNYSYKSIFEYPSNYLSAWQAGVIIWPVLIAIVINFFYRISQQYIKLQILKNSFIFFFVSLVGLFIWYEFSEAKRYPEFILQSDYSALLWIKENSIYENTLIYPPIDNANENTIPNYLTSFWVPIIAERKSVLFRNYNISGQFKFLNTNKPISEKINQLQKAAYSITDPDSYKVFNDMKITHIFISGFLAGKLFNMYQSSPFVKLIHCDTVPNQGTALVYKLKGPTHE